MHQNYSQEAYQPQGYPQDPQYESSPHPQDTYEGYDPLDTWESEEYRNGVRFSWNDWPLTKLDLERAVVPVSCLFTPLKPLQNPLSVTYDPLRCHNANCAACLNPYAHVDFNTGPNNKMWICPLCTARNQFPMHYSQHISPENLPAELMPEYTTIEYTVSNTVRAHQNLPPPSPVFMFVVDICQSMEELSELKDSLQQVLAILPEDCLVGMVTFGTMVQLHDLSFSEMPRSFVFRGDKVLPTEKLSHLLKLNPAATVQNQNVNTMNVNGKLGEPVVAGVNRFVLPVSECAAILDSILEDLRVDPWPVKNDQRPARCTGVAISLAASVCERLFPRQGCRIMLFISGPCTVGPGSVATRNLAEPMRSHTDIQKQRPNASLMKDATAFYQELSKRLVLNYHCLDVFAASLDQVGLLEMHSCVDSTGGLVVLADSFGQSVFKESLRRVFNQVESPPPEQGGSGKPVLAMGLAATIELICCKDVKIKGCLGACSSLGKKSMAVSENVIGQSGTYAWRMNAISPDSTLAFYFEVTRDQPKKGSSITTSNAAARHLQFITHYQHPDGTSRMRVTTVSGSWQRDITEHGIRTILPSFDQEAAAVLVSRAAVFKSETEETSDILRFLDRSLIRFCSRFANYTADNPSSFDLPQEMSIYPQFMFHLRRSPFLQVFNSSPDEACYRRMILMRENTRNSLVMIQPSLLSYGFHGPPEPVLLDVTSIQPNTILLLDTFFHVVVFHGETIAAWRDQGYQDQPEHENFRALLAAPKQDAQQLMLNRFPVPRYIVCDQHKSQSRFILAKLNPSVSNNPNASQQIFTDDVSLKVFMESLMKLAVQS